LPTNLKKAGDQPVAPTFLLSYALPASFKARSTFSGLSGNVLTRTTVVLWIALAIQAIGGIEAIPPGPR